MTHIIRLPEATWIETERDGWSEVRHLRQRRDRLRAFRQVRVWKGSTRRATVCLYRTRTADGKLTTWYLLTNLEGEQTRFFEYACRWWQECTHKLLKSALFDWEGDAAWVEFYSRHVACHVCSGHSRDRSPFALVATGWRLSRSR